MAYATAEITAVGDDEVTFRAPAADAESVVVVEGPARCPDTRVAGSEGRTTIRADRPEFTVRRG